MPANVHDVAILSDFRQPGPTTAGIAAEVQAQAEAALATVLVHVPAPNRPEPLPFRPRIGELIRDGAATLARHGEPVEARLLGVRRPWLLPDDLTLRGARTVLVRDKAPP